MEMILDMIDALQAKEKEKNKESTSIRSKALHASHCTAKILPHKNADSMLQSSFVEPRGSFPHKVNAVSVMPVALAQEVTQTTNPLFSTFGEESPHCPGHAADLFTISPVDLRGTQSISSEATEDVQGFHESIREKFNRCCISDEEECGVEPEKSWTDADVPESDCLLSALKKRIQDVAQQLV